MRNKTILIILLSLMRIEAYAQEKFEVREFNSITGRLPYNILMPLNFSADQQYPLVIFLHGSGERGNDNKSQLIHGAELFLKMENREKFPAVVVFPQCPLNDYWANVKRSVNEPKFEYKKDGEPTKSMLLLMQLLDSLLLTPYVDKDRVYVGGLSMGGMGTFELVSRMPDTFAAAFPICGGGYPESVKEYANKVNFWIFHGVKDDIIDPKNSERMVDALIEAGAKPKFTLYENANHNSWDSAFAEPELMKWIFSNSK